MKLSLLLLGTALGAMAVPHGGRIVRDTPSISDSVSSSAMPTPTSAHASSATPSSASPSSSATPSSTPVGSAPPTTSKDSNPLLSKVTGVLNVLGSIVGA